MRDNPVWLVFMITTIVYAYLSMSTSVEHECPIKNPGKSLVIGLAVIVVIAMVLAYFVSANPGYNWGTGALVAAIIVVCGAIPVLYIYRLRMKQTEGFEDLLGGEMMLKGLFMTAKLKCTNCGEIITEGDVFTARITLPSEKAMLVGPLDKTIAKTAESISCSKCNK